MRSLSSMWTFAVRHLFPWACAGCGTPLLSDTDPGFCSRCADRLPWIEGLLCRHCGIALPEGGMLCYACRRVASSLQIRSTFAYRGPIRDAIHRFKYGGRESLAPLLARWMASTYEQHFPDFRGWVVPVPLHPRSLHQRGYNQAALLAKEVSLKTGLPYIGETLWRRRRTEAQSKLNKDLRQQNVKNVFALNGSELLPALKGGSILLVDDVCTTGSTLRECAKTLRRAGVRDIRALALARDGC